MSYGSDDGFQAWLDSNGYVLPNGSPSIVVLRQRGSTYLTALYGSRFVGQPLNGVSQVDAWPRTVYDGAIPAAVIEASYQAAWYEANNIGGLVAGGSSAKQVKRQKVEGLEREFFGPSEGQDYAASLTPLISTVDGLLAPYLVSASACLGMWSI